MEAAVMGSVEGGLRRLATSFTALDDNGRATAVVDEGLRPQFRVGDQVILADEIDEVRALATVERIDRPLPGSRLADKGVIIVRARVDWETQTDVPESHENFGFRVTGAPRALVAGGSIGRGLRVRWESVGV